MLRKAVIKDIKEIKVLINSEVKKYKMLPRSISQLYENIRDFWVEERRGRIIGCCALHINWEDKAEIRSLVIKKKYRGQEIGKNLLSKCFEEAKELKIASVFVLTYVPNFFKKLGFKIIDKSELPHKIWSDCINCHYFPDCNETALIKKV
jgi:amino-acid N-acetyltransferase